MDELRETTRIDHKAGLQADDVALSKYVRRLERFYGYDEPLEYRLHLALMTDVFAYGLRNAILPCSDEVTC